MVRWPSVPAGTLILHYGFSQRAVDADHPGLPVTLVVKVGDQVVVDDILGEDDWDWREVVVPPSDGPGPREVTFTATTLDNGYRHLLFTADVWGAKNP